MQQADDWLGVPQVRHEASTGPGGESSFPLARRGRGLEGSVNLEVSACLYKYSSDQHQLFAMQTCVHTRAYTCKAD